MPDFIALLRAVNVGGTGTLAMADLRAACAACGFSRVRTVGASGNAAFRAEGTAPDIRSALAARLAEGIGRPVVVLVRTAGELAAALARNPFPDAPGNRVLVLFLDRAVTRDDLAGVADAAEDEAVLPGERELYILYGSRMGSSRLRVPAAAEGTARNINTLLKLLGPPDA